MNLHEDFERIRAYLNGDRLTGEDLFGETYIFVFRWVRSRIKYRLDLHDFTDDIVQNALCNALRKIDEYNGSRPFPVWVLGFAKNCLLEAHRRRIDFEYNDKVENTDSIIQDFFSLDPQTVIIYQEEHRLVHKVLEELPSNYRAILYQRIILKISYKEISAKTGQTVVSLEHLFRRAIKSARDLIRQYDNV